MRFRHRAAVTLTGLALFAGSVYATVTSDAFVRRLVRTLVSRTVRGSATAESASFSFLNGLEVRGLEVRDPDDPLGPPALHVEVLRAEWGLFLGEGGPRITEVFLEEPRAFVRRHADGTLSLASVLAPLSPDTSAMHPPPISVTRATAVYEDPSVTREGTVATHGVEGRIVPGEDGSWSIRVTGVSDELGPFHGVAHVEPGGDVVATIDFRKAQVSPAVLRRFSLPSVDELTALGVEGTLSIHAESEWKAGRLPEIRSRVESAELRFTAPLPEADPDAPRPVPIPVQVDALAATFEGGRLTVESASLRALGATISAKGTIEGLDLEGIEPKRIFAEAEVTGVRFGPADLGHFPASVRRIAEAYGFVLEADAHVRVKGPLASPRTSIDAKVRNGRLRYEGFPRPDGTRRGFPWDVTDIQGTVVLEPSGRVLLQGEGRHGPAHLTVDGFLDHATGDEDPDLRIVAKDVPADADLRAAFQDRAESIFDRWGPTGTIGSVEIHVHRDARVDANDEVVADVLLGLDGRASVRPRVFPIQLGNVTGRIEVTNPVEDGHRVEHVALRDVKGVGDGIEASVRGTVVDRLSGTEDFLRVDLAARDASAALSEAVAQAGEIDWTNVRATFDALRPAGPAEVSVDMRRTPAGDTTRVEVRLLGVSVRGWTEEIPLAATDLRGTVVVDDETVTTSGLKGTVLDVPVSAAGTLRILPEGGVDPEVRIEAEDLPLGDPLRRALGRLAEPARNFWDILRPQGGAGTRGARADAIVTLRPQAHETPVEISLRRIRGPLLPGGLELDHRDGALDYDGRTLTARLDAGIGGADVAVEAAIYDIATGRLRVLATTRGLQFPEDLETVLGPEATKSLLDAMPGRNLHATDAAVEWNPEGRRLTVEGLLTVTPRSRRAAPDPGLAPEGTIDVRHFAMRFLEGEPTTIEAAVAAADFKFDPGIAIDSFTGEAALTGTIGDDGLTLRCESRGATVRTLDRVFTGADLVAVSGPAGTRLDARATLASGEFRAKIGPGGARASYAGELHLRGAALADIVGSDAAGTQGRVDGDVFFRNLGSGADDLRGTVEITVREGDLVKVPLVSALSAFYPRAGTATDAAVRAEIDGRTLRLRELALRGPAVQLTADGGTIGLDGTIDVVIRTAVKIPVPIVGPLLSGGTSLASGVHVTGTLRNPTPTWSPFATPSDAAKREPRPVGDVGPYGEPEW